MPGKSLLVEHLKEWIGVKFLNVVHARLAPQPLEEHHGASHCGHSGGVAHRLHASFLKRGVMVAVVVDVVGQGVAVLSNSADATTDAGLPGVVLTQVLRVGQHRLEELQWHDFHALIHHGVDARHAYVLNHAQVGEVFLAKGHPEPRALEANGSQSRTRQVSSLQSHFSLVNSCFSFSCFSQ